MQSIPPPQVLDPNRILDNDRGDLTVDHEARAALLETALHESCAYAQQLWDTDNALRAYLMSSLPPDPRSPGAHPSAGASPAGPDDDQGWENWINAYAAVTSVLCGPQGDSGYGLGEARHAAQQRRTAPVLNLHAHQPGLGHADQEEEVADAAGERRGTARTPARGSAAEPAAASSGHRGARPALIAALVLLVIRRLRPRRSETR